ncbi:Copalyl diphosphate synthase [Quillaja saponaria]|uniref:Copalyl diphosphate synthase n=1 Tax=Quillaja saponaria TaxID=32244 RepID=A0AAD7Q9J5_QUISA|nr:Copalyl diphosphate synthase [Quillaja saponaria]KAJ7977389.1 Copalyl diphosphate synthase [Quillaja saponaria]
MMVIMSNSHLPSLSIHNHSLPSLSVPIFPSSPFSLFSKQGFPGVGSLVAKDKHTDTRCNAISKPRTNQEYADEFHGGPPVLKWHQVVEDDIDVETVLEDSSIAIEIQKRVKAVKSMLESMEDGEISISAYDTAWVALVKDLNGTHSPQFPSCLEWIANNQLHDGSWGDSQIFQAHDRILSTLACVIALKTWKIHPKKCEKGMEFLQANIRKLEDENAEHMPIGFEIAFPSLLEIAKSLDIQVPHEDSHVLKDIYESRNIKLTKIPREIMHKVPTTLLHSLEGMSGLEWKKLLKLQSKDGSFLFSPSATAFALMQTKDENCLTYLNKVVHKFNGGVPGVYPVDMFEHIWAIDRLERLGISRYFEEEIKKCVNYISRYWTGKGICWARNSQVQDIDDTSMAFRVLRLHGHDVSANVFKHFQKDNGEFFCFAGQSNQAVTGMYNLFRASQVMFLGETILKDAMQFSAKFLKEKRAANKLIDKWIITRDLPGEVGYALDIPWYASLPRLETRFYLEQYGGEEDVWIAKTLYRMHYVNNNVYLELAKLDYNNCQAVHRCEWDNIQRWYSESELGEYGLSKQELLYAYYLAAATIYEPERSLERLAWAKTSALIQTITSNFNDDEETRTAFVNDFIDTINLRDYSNSNKTMQGLVGTLVRTLDFLSLDTFVTHGEEIIHDLYHTWGRWLSSWQSEGNRHGETYLLVQMINLSGGNLLSEDLLSNPQYQQLLSLTNKVCHRLNCYKKDTAYGSSNTNTESITTPEIESDMQKLVQLILQNKSDGIDSKIKNSFLDVTKSLYYTVHCDQGTINFHIAKVLFERVL